MPARPPRQHRHEGELIGERHESHLRALRLGFVAHPAQRAYLRLVDALRRHQLDDLLHLREPGGQRLEPRKLCLLTRREFGHRLKIALLLTCTAAFSLAAQRRPDRWSLTLFGASLTDNAELRLDSVPRIVFEHSDQNFIPLRRFRRQGDTVMFDAGPYREFVGVMGDTLFAGQACHAGERVSFSGGLAAGDVGQGAILPRVRIRQLVLGARDSAERIPGDWMRALAPVGTLADSADALRRAAGIPQDDRNGSESRTVLGIDTPVRMAEETVMRAIVDGGDPVLRGIFAPFGTIQIDRFDVARSNARKYLVGFSVEDAVRGLQALHLISADTSAGAVEDALITLDDTPVLVARIDSLGHQGDREADAARALYDAYFDAEGWWESAVHALLTRPWIPTDRGRQSPAQLMETFWGTDSLALPRPGILQREGEWARATIGEARIFPRLVAPANGIAAEWLPHASADVFAAWKDLAWGTPLPLMQGPHAFAVVSPAQMRASAPALFGAVDEIDVTPHATPLAAVGLFLHEWQHIVVADRRFAGAHPAGLRIDGTTIEIKEDDQWLDEGLAEWATDETLRPAGAAGALLRWLLAEKRLAVAAVTPDDPHLLGYRMVVAASRRLSVPVLRDRIVASVDNLPAAARALGFGREHGQPPHVVMHPATAMVVPEITFRWADGAALDVTHRLLVPIPVSER